MTTDLFGLLPASDAIFLSEEWKQGLLADIFSLRVCVCVSTSVRLLGDKARSRTKDDL